MLDLKYVIANIDAVRENCRNRAVPADVLEDLLWRLPRPQLVDSACGGRGPAGGVEFGE